MTSPRKSPVWRTALKVLAWTVMALILTVVAALICVDNMLKPEHLTAIANRVANRMLDAEVSIGRVELNLTGRYPFARLDVDSVTVISKAIRRLPADEREKLPQWADTLLTLKHFGGGISLPGLLMGRYELNDIVFEQPGVNIATLNDSVSNYLIYTSTAEPDTTATAIPRISLNRFRLEQPRPLRYFNAATADHFTVELKNLAIDGQNTPSYALSVGGNVNSPALHLYNIDGLHFGIDGNVAWTPESPGELELRDFKFTADFLQATLDSHIDFTDDIIVRDYDLRMGEMGLERIIGVLPDSLQRAMGISADKLTTDVALRFSARSTGPFNLNTDSIPPAVLTLELTPGALTWGKARFRNVGGTITARLARNDLAAATVEVDALNVAGPATDLTLDARIDGLTDDPLVSGSLRGNTLLQRLPPQLADAMRGYISGRIRADITFKGRPSMLQRDTFHRLRVDGDIDGDDLYYLSNDTNNMIAIHRACLRFGANSTHGRGERYPDSLLTASVRVDSADILSGNIAMTVTDLALGAGASNRYDSADTTLVIPMGGGLKVGTFYLTSISDSIVFNVRDAAGRVTMKRFNGNARMPVFAADLEVGRISTGSPDVRFLLSGAQVHATAHKLPRRRIPAHIRHTADSLLAVHPELPIDSVYRYAILKHRIHRHRSPYPRVHPQYTAAETEIIDWGTSRSLRRLLLGWDLRGTVTARRAGLFTSAFPVRNRVRDFNVAFSTDTISLQNVRYKAGHSDFTISGLITNIKRGLTSDGFRSPLKINFDVVSDTIDINELASATFRGAAYTEARHHADSIAAAHRAETVPARGTAALIEREAAEDAELERELGRMVQNAPDSAAPLLIPRNIDARINLRAANVMYSDFNFTDFEGRVMAYRGALNLHRLHAASQAGALNLSALYSAPSADDIKFGFGLQVDRFSLGDFTRMVPAVDSVMPLLRDIKGIVNADIAATCDIDRDMNLMLPTLTAAIKIRGDSLAVIDKETYRTIGKWLLFKDKQSNIIDSMNVEMTIRDNRLELYPFIFNIDRYRLGVQGYNDLALNFDYHISVLKSPLPFKFGINIKGNPDKYKVRLGKSRFNRQQAVKSVSIVDTARVNLLQQIENIFRRGVSNSRFARLNIDRSSPAAAIDLSADTISHADSLEFIRRGLIPAPPAPADSVPADKKAVKAKKRKSDKKKGRETSAVPARDALLPDRLRFNGKA